MRLVILESPFAGDIEKNLHYGRLCMHDCLVRYGEAPYASHLLYTQPGVLRDKVSGERELGMEAGFAWRSKADATVIYTDLGISGGMEEGARRAEEMSHKVEYRRLPPHLLKQLEEVSE